MNWKRNLLFHLYPSGQWMKHIDELGRYRHVFNGKRVFVIAADSSCSDNQAAAREAIQNIWPDGVTIFHRENDPELRETATLVDLLQEVESVAEDEITFYAHSKGTRHANNPAVKLWTHCLYLFCLGFKSAAEEALLAHPCSGAFKRYGHFSCMPESSEWHYSGAFFWFRNKDLFSKDWKQVPRIRHGAEAYLSMLFSTAEAHCRFVDGVPESPYDIDCLQRMLKPSLVHFNFSDLLTNI